MRNLFELPLWRHALEVAVMAALIVAVGSVLTGGSSGAVVLAAVIAAVTGVLATLLLRAVRRPRP
jgi:hypothetical protein